MLLEIDPSQYGNNVLPEHFMCAGNLIEGGAPMEHRKKMTGTDGAALGDDLVRNTRRRADDQLVATHDESSARYRFGVVRHWLARTARDFDNGARVL